MEIASFVLTVIGWILPQGIHRFKARFITQRPLRRFWRRFTKNTVIAVVPPADKDPEIKGTQVFDFLGLIELQKALEEIGCTIKFVRADNVSAADLQHNLLLIGGPIPNAKTAELLAREDLPYHFSDHAICRKADPTWMFKAEKDNEIVLRDFGLITKTHNLYNKAREVVSLCGCYGWGTQAACRILMDRESLNFLSQRGRKLQALCTCIVSEDRVIMDATLVDLHPKPDIKRPTVKVTK